MEEPRHPSFNNMIGYLESEEQQGITLKSLQNQKHDLNRFLTILRAFLLSLLNFEHIVLLSVVQSIVSLHVVQTQRAVMDANPKD